MSNVSQTTRLTELITPIRYIEPANYAGAVTTSAWFDFATGGFSQYVAVLETGAINDTLSFSILRDGLIDTDLFSESFSVSNSVLAVNFSAVDVDIETYTRIRLRVSSSDSNSNNYGATLWGGGPRYVPASENLSVSFLKTMGLVNGIAVTLYDGTA